MKVLSTFLALTLAAAASVSAQSTSGTATTDPVGYNTFTLYAGNNVRVNTFVQSKSFQGVAQSITSASNSVITLSGSSFNAGAFNEVGGTPAYHLEILDSGSTQGMIVDVVSNTASTVTVSQNLAQLGVSGSASFCIRPHTTLSSLFPATSTLAAYVDTVKLFYPNNTNRSFLFTGSGSGWIDAGTGADAGNEIIYPGQGFIIYVAAQKNVTISGAVKSGPTIVPLYAGAINLVGTINPMVSGSQSLSQFSFPSTFSPYVDSAKPFTDDGTLRAPTAYLSDGSQMIDAGLGTAANPTITPPNAIVVGVAQSKNWIMPSFYTSGQ